MAIQQESSIKEAWTICLVLGVLALNFPFIHIFDNDRLIFGIPILVIYFFLGWPASILVIWLYVRKINHGAAETENKTASGKQS